MPIRASRGSTRSRRTWKTSTISASVLRNRKGQIGCSSKSTSYVISDYISAKVSGGVRNIRKLRSTSKTMVIFEGADVRSTGFVNEHVHCASWFSDLNKSQNAVMFAIQRDVQLDRHQVGAHYLYVDTHVDLLEPSAIQEWVDADFDFARPQ